MRRRWTCRAGCARCSRKRRADAAISAAPSSRCAQSPPCRPLANCRHIRLDQVATVADTVSEPRALATQNGREVVGFEIFRTRGASEVRVAEGARAAVAELQAAHPGVQLTQVIDNA